MELLKYFVAAAGDFQFRCDRDDTGICSWSRRPINTMDPYEPVGSLEDVPVVVLHAFAHEQVAKQARSAA